MSASFRLLRGPITDNQLTNGTQDSGVVAATSQNDYFAVWHDTANYYGGHEAIVGRHFDANGNALASQIVLNPVNDLFNFPFYASDPSAVRLPRAGQDDGLAVSFTNNFNNGGVASDLYVVRTNANLVRLENPILVANTTAFNSAITSFANGSLVVAYVQHNNINDWDILANTVAPNGIAGNAFTLFDDLDNSDNVDLATLTNGNFVAVWQSEFLADAADNDIWFTISHK